MNARTRRREPLAGTKPALMPDPREPVDPVRREQDLRAIFDEPRPVGTRPSRRLRLVTIAAATASAAVFVATTPASDVPDAGASPREVLLAAADAVANADLPAEGRYWHIRRRTEGIHRVPSGPGHGAYLMVGRSGSETWDSRTGAEDSLAVYNIDLAGRPLTPTDEAEWAKAGSPATIPGLEPMPVAIRGTGENAYNVGGMNRPMSEVLGLPTGATELKAYLLEQFHAHPPTGEDPRDETEWLVMQAEGLLASVPTTPGTRAAAYRLLAGLPGYRVLDAAELPAGSGVGVARTTRGGWNGLVDNGLLELQMIIDPGTGSLRMERIVLLEPGTEDRKLPAGTVINTDTVERIGWDDTDPVVPAGAVEHAVPAGN